MMRFTYLILFLTFIPLFSQCKNAPEERDRLKVMTYNVLKYGDGCQGPNSVLHGYLKTIVGYTNPDILGLVKIESIPKNAQDKGKAPIGFADSILNNALNAAYPDKYAYCPVTNVARDKDGCILFYNKHKLALSRYATLVSDISDIDMYKLYYLSPNLSKTHDTAFLYIVLLHTDSGDKPTDRDRQLAELMAAIKKYFSVLPNIIVMGDFNLRKTNEDGYQAIVNSSDKKHNFIDPPFAVDHKVSYPANWDKHPERFASFLTTSTRKKQKKPNDCGTGGGAKGWYDHIFLSPQMANQSNVFHYRPGTYRTIGNDGKRIDASVNDMPNNAAPPAILEALYQMSNKYPVTIELGISPRK